MSFADTNIPVSITTGYQDPISDLFVPLLENAVSYDIAVGYFTSGWLRDTAEGMARFAHAGGKSRWVISPSINKRDAQSIMDGEASYSENNFSDIERDIADHIAALKADTREELCALIGSGVLQFRIAIPKKNQGMFHAKIGVATDSAGQVLGFSGSYNLTAAAKSNWENIEIFRGWIPNEKERIDNLTSRFQSLWQNSDPTYDVMPPSTELMKYVSSLAGEKLGHFIKSNANESDNEPISLRPYQTEAIENWRRAKCRGTFVMATGSGKTITALSAIIQLKDIVVKKHGKSLLIVIAVPLKHLLDQWYEEVNKFQLPAVRCYESSAIWTSELTEKISILNVVGGDCVVALVTNTTFAMPQFQAQIRKCTMQFLFIADEAHNLGASSYIDALPENAQFRLALSATPERFNDAAGTKALFDYFGKPVINFSIDDAIGAGFLCPYHYHPHICEMSGQEYEEYLEIAEQMRTEVDKEDVAGEKTKEYVRLLGKRADLVTRVESKLLILVKELKLQSKNDDLSHTLIYCGSRRGENSERHIERTQRIIGTQVGLKAHKFTSEEPTSTRKQILDMFASGELQAITAIKCLDEGVDIPATRVAYILASTANPREFIQRRGRVLRLYPGKNAAYIHDFIVTPPPGSAILDDLVEHEISRAREFSRLALNQRECEEKINKLSDEQ